MEIKTREINVKKMQLYPGEVLIAKHSNLGAFCGIFPYPKKYVKEFLKAVNNISGSFHIVKENEIYMYERKE